MNAACSNVVERQGYHHQSVGVRGVWAIVIIATAIALPACLPSVNQTTWSALDRSGQVTLSASSETAHKWVDQCQSQRSGMQLSALGTVGLSLATGVAAGASMGMEEGGNRTMVSLGAVAGAALSAYLGMRAWYGAKLYSTMCMAFEGTEVPPEE